ncbi:holo-ACP synthase [Flexivirga sp. B27]
MPEAPSTPDAPEPTAPPTPPVTVRVGTDVHDIARIEGLIRRHGRRYLDRTFTSQEVQSCGGYTAEPHLLAPGLAARFCAKEAALKVLRPAGILPEWTDMEIINMPGGWLRLKLSGIAAELAEQRGLVDLQVSISFEESVAVATVVGVGSGRPPPHSASSE